MSNLDNTYLEHYGTPRHSGRYPWGSGKNPQRNKNFLRRVRELEDQGLSEKEIANAFGISTGVLRNKKTIASNEEKMDLQAQMIRLRDKGMSPKAIAERLGESESKVRDYLKPNKEFKSTKTINVANELEAMLKEKPYLDVGEGVDRQLGISEVQLTAALDYLKDKGYSIETIYQPQATNPTQKTAVRVLAAEGTTKKDIYDHREDITSPDGIRFEDYGATAIKREPPKSIDSARVMVRYNEDGGSEKDGVIEIRPGVEDISLGGRNYAQVRVLVNGTHYMKGMAMYGYDMPDGVDIIYNSNKHRGTPEFGSKDNTVFKPVKDDPMNPFGSTFDQWQYTDSKGNKVLSPINIVNDDESWDKWQKTLSSQFLSKQPNALAKRQLDIDYSGREQDLREILSIPNPTVKRQLLETFADECDSAAVHLKGAALPRQGTFAILPVKSLKDNEVFAPKYDNGEEVILVRFPHAGPFEIPRLVVNNRNKEALATITNKSEHAIGINSNVAKILSGADYDGDTVLVIPTKGQKINTRAPLFTDFDPQELYKNPPGAKETGKKGEGFNKGIEMGKISNLITDMTIKGAGWDEISRAVKHSMVVIDAEKHNLDWRRSETDQGIAELRLKYQGKEKGGASTLLSRRKNEAKDVWEREEIKYPSVMTPEELTKWQAGEKVYRETGRMYKPGKYIKDPDTGERVYVEKDKLVRARPKETVYAILEAKDVKELGAGYPIENIYADYANRCKRLANEARKELRVTGKLQQNAEAKKMYADEVKSLNDKLNLAALNAPKERQAQLIAGKNISAKVQADPSLKDKENKDKLSKMSNKEIAYARDLVGAKRHPIDITPKEWEAVQAGAISDTKLTQILRYTDTAKVRQLATPRSRKGMSSSMKSRARTLIKAGYPLSDVAQALGVSVNTLSQEIKVSDVTGGDK